MAGSASWERRNARARALGYENYYDYRAHDYGSRPAGDPRAKGETLARLRGHRGSRDLEHDLRAGKVIALNPLRPTRDDDGKVVSQPIEVVYADGSSRVFTLKGASLDPEKIRDLEDAAAGAGVPPIRIIGSPPRRQGARSDLDEDLDELVREELEDLASTSDAELAQMGFSPDEIAELREKYGSDDGWEEVAIPF